MGRPGFRAGILPAIALVLVGTVLQTCAKQDETAANYAAPTCTRDAQGDPIREKLPQNGGLVDCVVAEDFQRDESQHPVWSIAGWILIGAGVLWFVIAWVTAAKNPPAVKRYPTTDGSTSSGNDPSIDERPSSSSEFRRGPRT